MRRRGLSRRQTGVMAEGWMTRRGWSNRGHGRPQVAPDVGVGSVADPQVGGFVQRAIGFEPDVALAVAVAQERERVAGNRPALERLPPADIITGHTRHTLSWATAH